MTHHTSFHKKYKLLLPVLLLACLCGCRKNFLDVEPQGTYTTDTYPYPGGSGPYDTYIFSAYAEMRSFNTHSQSFICATLMRSDDADKGSTPSDGGADASSMDNFPVLPNNGFCNTLWTGYYTLISKTNVAIDQIHNNANIQASPEIKAQSEGEVRWLRAYAYFMLVRLFDRVPLIDSVLTDPASQSNIPQSSASQIYASIESDLQFAAANLPASWDPTKFPGRLTSGAANGLLAKVYLTEKKWDLAMSTADLVISSGQYDLSTAYDKIFREDGENSKESVFEIQATASQAVQTANGVQYASIMGVRGSGTFNMGWGWATPSADLAGTYEAGDPRRARTIMFTSDATHTYQTIYGETIPVGLPNPMYNNKVYTNPTYRAATGSLAGYWMNVRILRFADVVLMYAEAAAESGHAQEALAKLEMVRARARNGNNAILPPVTTTDQDSLITAIRHERRVEMGMEHDRFFDLVRWGIAQQTLNAAGKTAFSDSRDVLLPIPQTQIDLSKGVLTQNLGY
ncbi:MAG TPA: RagB/SusD family nutrient uptake outer membrane protein [Puia sp.]|nr:RagB/SusD family nutrient uptake outer membrane protein [Puia sp.]